MKKILGSLIIFYMTSLGASTLCDYDFKVSNFVPFVKEFVEIEFTATQKDKSGVMFFELTPLKSENFELHFMGKTENKKSYHDNEVIYRYVLFPLKSGTIDLSFDFKVSLATDESVEKFYTGNRDVINPMAAKVTMIDLEPLSFAVKTLERSVDLIGDFKLDFKFDKKEVSSFEQLNIIYKLTGHGYMPNLKEILPKIDGVEYFLERVGEDKSFIKNGEKLFHYALLSDRDFEVPEIKIECFSPKTQKYYTLKTLSKKIKVFSTESKNLLDRQDSYPTSAFEGSDYLPYINGFLLFLSGFIVAKLNLMQFIKKSKKAENPIKDIKDEKELLKTLLSYSESKYRPFIEQLESSIYEGKKCDLKEIKAKLSNL